MVCIVNNAVINFLSILFLCYHYILRNGTNWSAQSIDGGHKQGGNTRKVFLLVDKSRFSRNAIIIAWFELFSLLPILYLLPISTFHPFPLLTLPPFSSFNPPITPFPPNSNSSSPFSSQPSQPSHHFPILHPSQSPNSPSLLCCQPSPVLLHHLRTHWVISYPMLIPWRYVDIQFSWNVQNTAEHEHCKSIHVVQNILASCLQLWLMPPSITWWY